MGVKSIKDLFDLGKSNTFKGNRVLHGNCFDLLSKIPPKTFDLLVTDPPFYVMNKKNLKFKNRANIIQNAEFDGFFDYDSFLKFTKKWSQMVSTVLKDDAAAYIFFGAQYISDLLRIYLDLGFDYKGIIIWHKTNPVPKIRKNGYLSSTELILFMSRGNPTFNFLGQREMHNFIETPLCMRPERLIDDDPKYNKDRKFPSLHPTQKPKKVIKKLMQVSSNTKQCVLDPFAGTGTVNVVSKSLNRHCLGIEKDQKYYEASVKRLKSLNLCKNTHEKDEGI